MALGAKTQQILEIVSRALETAFKTIADLTAKNKNDDVALAKAQSEIAELSAELADVDSSVSVLFEGAFKQASDLLDQVNKVDPPSDLPDVPPTLPTEPPDGSTPEPMPNPAPDPLPAPVPDPTEPPVVVAPLPADGTEQPPSIR